MIERPHSNETLRDTSPFYRLWPEALAGEAIIERFLHGDDTFEYSPIALMQALLVQTAPFRCEWPGPHCRLGARHDHS